MKGRLIDTRRQRHLLAIVLACVVVLLAGHNATTAAAACPNEALRSAQSSAALPAGTTYLPDCMALEMISPPVKYGQSAAYPTFSPNAARVRFRSAAGVAGTPGLQSLLDSYIATRTGAGWALAPTSPPSAAAIIEGTGTKGGPYTFNPDLDSWLVLGATKAENQVGIGRIYSGGLGGSFAPLSPLLVPTNDSGAVRIVVDFAESESTGSSLDLSTTVFYPKLPSTSYLPGDPISPSPGSLEPGGDRNSYVAFKDALGEPALQLLARDGDDNVYGGRCGSHLGGGVGSGGSSGRLNQGAISPEGSRIYFSTRPGQSKEDEEEGSEGQCDPGAHPLRIFKRQSGPFGADPAIGEIAPGGGVEEPGDDLYQGASADGTKVFFTTTRQLTAADQDSGASCSATIGASAGCDLYLYDETRPEGERLTDVSAAGNGHPSPGEGAEVLKNVVAISGDGSRAYFAAAGVLTTDPNPEGDVAQAGQPNLYLYQRDAEFPAGRTAFLGALAAGDAGGLWSSEESFGNDAYSVPLLGPGGQGGGDGRVLFFASKAALTDDDPDTGSADAFRYDAEAHTLERISKPAPGGSEVPAADVTVGSGGAGPNANFAETGRWASEDGLTAVFSSAEPLVPGDDDEAANPYIWKASAGEVFRLPSDSEAPTVSHDGASVAFASTDPLLPQDGDSALDVYVARAGGGFPIPPAAQVCAGESCQLPIAPPPAPLPASSTFVGPGNVKPRKARKAHQKKCRKGFVKRKGKGKHKGKRKRKCVKRNKGAKRKKANNNRGGRR